VAGKATSARETRSRSRARGVRRVVKNALHVLEERRVTTKQVQLQIVGARQVECFGGIQLRARIGVAAQATLDASSLVEVPITDVSVAINESLACLDVVVASIVRHGPLVHARPLGVGVALVEHRFVLHPIFSALWRHFSTTNPDVARRIDHRLDERAHSTRHEFLRAVFVANVALVVDDGDFSSSVFLRISNRPTSCGSDSSSEIWLDRSLMKLSRPSRQFRGRCACRDVQRKS
jgi:hypothetical protein